MIPPISHPLSPPEPPKTHFSSRFSFSVNWKQVMTIAAIFFIIMMPFVAAAAAPLVPRFHGDVQTRDNGTCSMGPMNPLMIKAYLDTGTIAQQHSPLEPKEEHAHPADLALYYHLERQALSKLEQSSYRYDRKVKELQYLEAETCRDAALIAPTSEEQLAWIGRGFQELGKMGGALDPKESKICLFSEEKEKCALLSSLWQIAAKAFLALPPDSRVRFFNIVDVREFSPPFTSPTFLAAQCFSNAAYSLRLHPDKNLRLALYNASLELQKTIDVSSLSLSTITKLHVEHMETCIGAWNVERWKETPKEKELAKRTFNAAMATQDLYERLMNEDKSLRSYYAIKRATPLMVAASFSTDLDQKAQLYELARDLAEEAWVKDRTTCYHMSEFFNWEFYSGFNEEYSLLGRLRHIAKQAREDSIKASAWTLSDLIDIV